ncbi:RNA-binding domain-containing protein [Candidatus Electrothrix sp.]|uniref:RNA-binding domain-containing protein n=1 Tax=Candidatus Electrothrix sp. TaxID=2170559 RepID=UPI00405753ED
MINKTEEIKTVASFVNELISLARLKSYLNIAASNFFVFENVQFDTRVVFGLYSWERCLSKIDKFDLILGDLPLAMGRPELYEFGKNKLKIRCNWREILKSLQYLSENGLAIFIVEPYGFGISEGKKLEAALNSEGYFISAIFNAPEGILRPETSITPVFVVIKKGKTNSVFIAELLDESQAHQVAKNYHSGIIAEDLARGMMIEKGTFQGFPRIRIKQQIEKLETQYKEYKAYSIGDIAREVNSVAQGKEHCEKRNSLYIPKIGNSPVVTRLADTTIKHHYYFQVVLNEKADNEYVSVFFKSKLGRLILQSLTSGQTIRHLSKRDLEQATIALPSSDVQELIIDSQHKLHKLKSAIDSFNEELALNPTSSTSISSQLDNMLKAIGGLTKVDEVYSLIRQGESKTIEFKETLSLDVRKKSKEKYIELSVLKTIVAFLNTEGGVLLVGVTDKGNIQGLDIEINKFYKGNKDKFFLHVKNLIKKRIGEEFYPFIEYELIKVKQKDILVVSCKGSNSPCYLDNAEFYVRTNPATDKLDGPKLVEYVKNHFG